LEGKLRSFKFTSRFSSQICSIPCSFNEIACDELEALGAKGEISEEFCSLFPKNISSICKCRQSSCSVNETKIKVAIEFDNFPQHISWNVINEFGNILWSIDFGNYVQDQSEKPSFHGCLPKTGPLFFTILDRQQDGLCCESDSEYFLPSANNGYEVYLDDTLVAVRQFPIGSKQELVFRNGNKSSAVTINQVPVWCADCQRCKICPDDNNFRSDESIYFELYGEQSCSYYSANTSNFITTEFCNQIQDHVSSSCGCLNYQPVCSGNESHFIFRTVVEDSPGFITLHIRNQNNVTIWSKVGFAGNVGESRDYQTCVSSIERVYVGVYDYCGDKELCRSALRSKSFEILLNNKLFRRQVFNKPAFEFLLN
jgi:hypothetical protein